MLKMWRLFSGALVLAVATIVPAATPAGAAVARPSCGNGASSTCLHKQIAWEAAKALSGSRADGTSSRTYGSYYESDWRAPSYPSSDQNALDHIDDRLPRSLWGNYYGDYRGGQCFFFAHDVTYRASHAYLRLPSRLADLYAGGTADRTRWQAGDILQYDPSTGSPHTAVLWRVNSRDGSGRATSVEVIDSNWNVGNGPERIIRHTLSTSLTGKSNIGSGWRAYGPGRYS